MLTQDKIISIFCIIDDILQEINHLEPSTRKVSDSKIMITALISAYNFSGNQYKAMVFMKHYGFIPNMLEKSRFNRRLHLIKEMFYFVFTQIVACLKYLDCCLDYIVDSFPVSSCDNIRILRSKRVKGEKWRGYTASMKRYFYGIKVQLVTTDKGIPVDFHFTIGKQADVKALDKIIYKLPAEACLYADSAYTDYRVEDLALEKYSVLLKTQRKSNAKGKDSKDQTLHKLKMRKRIETTISDIKKLFPKSIHAVRINGFLIKVTLFIIANQVSKLFN